jgi:hypothetical protein
LPNEKLKDNFSRLNNIVNELKDLKFDVPDVDISHKFLRALPLVTKKKCFKCGEMGHISTNCKSKDEDNSSKKKFVGKKKLFKKYNKKKNGNACYVEWDSDASLDSNSSDDDDVKPSKKGLTRIAIKEAPSLFDTPYCLMAKGEPKLCESDEFTYDDPIKMVSEGPDKATRGGG